MEKPLSLPFPKLGLFRGAATNRQPALTSSEMLNCRLYDTLSNKARGGQRPGWEKWGDGDLIGGAEQPVVAMCVIDTVE